MFPEDTTRRKRYYPENYVYNPLNDVLLHSSENIPPGCYFIFHYCLVSLTFSAYRNVDTHCFVAKRLVHP